MKKIELKQQAHFFIMEIVSFAVIFITLGVIVNFAFQTVLYQNVDQSLMQQKRMLLSNQHQSQLKGKAQIQTKNKQKNKKSKLPPDFRTSILIFNKKGQIDNAAMLGDHYDLLVSVKLNQKQRNKITTISLANGSNFRSLLIKMPSHGVNPLYRGRYVQIMENIDSTEQALQSFRRILIMTMIFFWILSLILSYLLSWFNMQPLLKAWQKQQEFVANAAHELRTPLTVIQSKLEFLLTKPNEKIIDQTEPIALSLSETRRLSSLTRDLLVLARSDSNMTQIQREATAIRPFLEEVIAPYSEIAASQEKDFESDIQLDRTLWLDQKQIHQLIVILLDNALKYKPAHESIRFVARQNNNHWQLIVADTGRGIAPENREHIFERFYREDKAHSRAIGGNGLGLAIAKRIIDNHQGTIKVAANQPQGTQFIVTFPMLHNEPHQA
ncbi:sensor histidine kinase [Loigolactobacillus bifermentans]|uniref:histidine kinase n=1 Tax=Loigolactobacillus bifermentans DSM 20003 TaxID=1423726 RepID=A0A0R1GP04_9LACO|nr:ATP-binding protein [Loigolactobacillus bifermentans]KRK34147.1 Signal transduction histidine kinase [Loigolactobacillus bifermentans DSM 20003]QGG59267.1 sensor histidine kinase [Loigolactobacillus bifermentans]